MKNKEKQLTIALLKEKLERVSKKKVVLENISPIDYEVVTADWKEDELLIEGFRSALKHFGINMYNHPRYEGTDSFGFILTRENLTPEQLDALADEDFS